MDGIEMVSAESGELQRRWQALLVEEPRLRIRDAAERLAVSELELRATQVGRGVVRLRPEWADLLLRLPSLGRVMALTRNASVVHEKIGVYENLSVDGQTALALGHDIDLRIFLNRWAHGVAVALPSREGPVARSIEIFDAHGTALHKVHLREESDIGAFDALVDAFAAEDQSSGAAVTAPGETAADVPDADIDVEAFRSAWRALQDTHHFFPLLRRFGVSRTQALRLAPSGYVRPVAPEALRTVLMRAATVECPIMVFVGSPGVIQIHTGPVKQIRVLGSWLNVLDHDFSLHAREDHVAETWVVEKPTADGTVTSLEVFDRAGHLIVQLFGERKPGRPELSEWRSILAGLGSPRR